MIEIVTEFVVKEDAWGQFELVYGRGGAWSKLFARSAGFRGTTLMRDAANPGRYLVVEFWDTLANRDQVLAEQQAQYAELEATLVTWSRSITEVGVFRVLAEAAVQPRGRERRGKAAEVRRRSRRPSR